MGQRQFRDQLSNVDRFSGLPEELVLQVFRELASASDVFLADGDRFEQAAFVIQRAWKNWWYHTFVDGSNRHFTYIVLPAVMVEPLA